MIAIPSFKASETLLGIETLILFSLGDKILLSFKASETLLGIETLLSTFKAALPTEASKPLKPF